MLGLQARTPTAGSLCLLGHEEISAGSNFTPTHFLWPGFDMFPLGLGMVREELEKHLHCDSVRLVYKRLRSMPRLNGDIALLSQRWATEAGKSEHSEMQSYLQG